MKMNDERRIMTWFLIGYVLLINCFGENLFYQYFYRSHFFTFYNLYNIITLRQMAN